MNELIWAGAASMLAGLIDAIVGGGGLVMLPSLLNLFPNAPLVSLLGINKGTSIWGTATAAMQYAKRVKVPRKPVLAGTGAALLGSIIGAWLATLASSADIKRALPFVFIALLIYTLWNKNLGQQHTPRYQGRAEALAMGGIGLAIGMYDGFLGPGTGSFLVFLIVKWLGYDFLHASAAAKVLNTASNFSALMYFTYHGHVWWHVVAVTAVANVVGSIMGARLAMRQGTQFVRWVFVAVVSAFIVKML